MWTIEGIVNFAFYWLFLLFVGIASLIGIVGWIFDWLDRHGK